MKAAESPSAARRARPVQDALIVGGGIGGLMAALALAERGHKVRIFERAHEFAEVGAGLQLAPNATGILRRHGILERLSGLGAVIPEALRIRRAADGAQLARLPLGSVALVRWGAPYMAVHRADLQRALIEKLQSYPAVSVALDAKVTGFASLAEGIEIGGTHSGTLFRASGDFVVAADGLRSVLREKMGLAAAATPVYSGRTAWRALVPAAAAPSFALRLESNIWLGRRAHLVHYPLRGGDLVNIVAIAEDGWRGTDEADIWAIDDDPRAVQHHFRHWHPEARALIGAADAWRKWPLFDCAPLPRWSTDRVALLGDAAHPMLPFLAQGASQAIEDADALAGAFDRSDDEPTRAFSRYESMRIGRATSVQLASRQQGRIYHLGRPTAWARDVGLRALGPVGLMSRYDWLYRFASEPSDR